MQGYFTDSRGDVVADVYECDGLTSLKVYDAPTQTRWYDSFTFATYTFIKKYVSRETDIPWGALHFHDYLF